MKKTLTAITVFLLLTAVVLFSGCNSTPRAAALSPLSLDLSQWSPTDTAVYDAAAGGIVCTFGDNPNQYAQAISVSFEEWTVPLGYNTVTIIGKTYKADGTEFDMNSNWDARISCYVTINGDNWYSSKSFIGNYNMGTEDQIIDYSSVSFDPERLEIERKTTAVSKMVINQIIFSVE